MYSLQYIIAHTRGIRKILAWFNARRLAKFERLERARYQLNPLDLRHFEKKIFSQNGEDGIIEEIFNRVGTTNQYFVEFGVESGVECCTRYLLEKKNWRGVWLDGSETNTKIAQEKFKNFNLQVQNTFITAENIENLLIANAVPVELDLLVIDIDGNDYWVWKAIIKFKPLVVMVEYNASYSPPSDWVMPYNAAHQFDGTRNHGVSLVKLNELAKEKGYTLVSCDKRGVNAFFLRNDLFDSKKFTEGDVDYFYSAPKFHGFFFGHPAGKGPWLC